MLSTLNHVVNPIARAVGDREVVVLLHGLAANRGMLRPLERFLERSGFETLNWGYASIRGDIRKHSEAFGRRLAVLSQDRTIDRVHLVTHSMGSIIARAALTSREFNRVGRIVMLGPPHRGSRVAANLSAWLGWLCRPLVELSDHPASFVNTLPEPVGHEIGIIAASRDRVVRVENTCLSNQTDHVVVETGHTSMLFRGDVAEYVECFLRQGDFSLADPRTRSAALRSPINSAAPIVPEPRRRVFDVTLP